MTWNWQAGEWEMSILINRFNRRNPICISPYIVHLDIGWWHVEIVDLPQGLQNRQIVYPGKTKMISLLNYSPWLRDLENYLSILAGHLLLRLLLRIYYLVILITEKGEILLARLIELKAIFTITSAIFELGCINIMAQFPPCNCSALVRVNVCFKLCNS